MYQVCTYVYTYKLTLRDVIGYPGGVASRKEGGGGGGNENQRRKKNPSGFVVTRQATPTDADEFIVCPVCICTGTIGIDSFRLAGWTFGVFDRGSVVGKCFLSLALRDHRTGHAGSMNLILSLTKTRYLLYAEDDWWALRDRKMPSTLGTENFLWRAMDVLRNSAERVSQASNGATI